MRLPRRRFFALLAGLPAALGLAKLAPTKQDQINDQINRIMQRMANPIWLAPRAGMAWSLLREQPPAKRTFEFVVVYTEWRSRRHQALRRIVDQIRERGALVYECYGVPQGAAHPLYGFMTDIVTEIDPTTGRHLEHWRRLWRVPHKLDS